MSCRKCISQSRSEKSSESSKCSSVKPPKPEKDRNTCASKLIQVKARPKIPIHQEVKTNIAFPISIFVGPPVCPKKDLCDAEKPWPKDYCESYKKTAVVPISFPLDTELNPQVELPVNVFAQKPECARCDGYRKD